MPAALSLAFELLASALAPSRCAACDTPVRILRAFCSHCADSVQPYEASRPNAIAAFAYGGPVARAIVRLKYERRPDIARPLGDLLFRSTARAGPLPRDTLVVPVPLHPVRLAERGFNQAALLAHRVAHGFRLPLHALALRRTRNTDRQAALEKEHRGRNVAHAFAVRRRARVAGKRVLLVDDVRTTGATLEACAVALRAAGVIDVMWAVVAQAGE